MSGRASRTLGTAAIITGVLLLLSPAALGAVDLGAPTHTYGVAYVETTDDGYDVSGTLPPAGGVDERVLCWGSRSRACMLERTLIDDDLDGYSGWMTSPGYRFVFGGERFYSVASSPDRIWLEERSLDEVLDGLARPDGDLPGRAQSALSSDDREFETRNGDLATARLIQVEEDRYATLSYDGSARSTLDVWLERIEPVLPLVGFALGLYLVLWGQATRMRKLLRR